MLNPNQKESALQETMSKNEIKLNNQINEKIKINIDVDKSLIYK